MTALTITHGNGGSNGRGGGVLVDANAQLTMNNVRVTGNAIPDGDPARGGGVANFGALTLNQCVISQNLAASLSGDATSGGGLFQGGGSGTLTIRNSTIGQNTAQGGEAGRGQGGGLFLQVESGPVSISGSTFAGNRAMGGSATSGGGDVGDAFGGGVYQESGAGSLTIVNSTFSGNQAVGGLNGVETAFRLGVRPLQQREGGATPRAAAFSWRGASRPRSSTTPSPATLPSSGSRAGPPRAAAWPPGTARARRPRGCGTR